MKNIMRVFALTGLLLILSSGMTVQGQEPFVKYPYFMPGYRSIKIYDSHSRFVGRIIPEKRYWASIESIPVFLQMALIAIEDVRFYEHGGIDLRGITRALMKDVLKGKMAEGGSTITQQLIKNKYFSGDKTLERKVKEGLLAVEYERKYTKKQILEMYFNEVYFGNGAWGIVQAARLYFDKYPQELTEAECALLAGIPKAPSHYNPLEKYTSANSRKNLILKRMAELQMISATRAKKIQNQRPSLVRPGEASYYTSHIRRKLTERYGAEIIEKGGLDVITAMDLNLQRHAEKVLRENIEHISPNLQGALLSMDIHTGDVLAVAGGTNFKKSAYNRALFAKRQPGSAIKPLIFAAALEKGITAGSIWNDEPVSYDGSDHQVWKPRNYGNEQFGNLSLRQALAYSNNIIAVKLLESVGVDQFVDFAARLGLSLKIPNDLSLALGTEEVTLIEMMQAYSPLATSGIRTEPRTIIRIYDRYRNAWTEIPPSVTETLSPDVAYITTSMLKDTLTYGTAKSLKEFSLAHPAAGKTGTTDDYRDAWFIGYTPQIMTGVWVGYDKPSPGGKKFTGGGICAPIWKRFMSKALAQKPATDFPKPESVLSFVIDPAIGKLATPDCPEKREEFYISGTQPTEDCPLHRKSGLTPPSPETEPAMPNTFSPSVNLPDAER